MANIAVTISPAENPPITEEEEEEEEEEGGGSSFKDACDIQDLFELDDFDQFSARASSGGSLYGVLRKQALLQALGAEAGTKGSPTHVPQEFLKRSNFLSPPGPIHPHRRHNRSKSLVHRKQTLTDDKSILKYLYDYSKNLKPGSGQLAKRCNAPDIRRHSEATMNCRLLIQSGNLSPEVISEVASELKSSISKTQPESIRSPNAGHSSGTKDDPAVPPQQTSATAMHGRQNRLQSLQPSSSSSPPTRPVPNVSVCRRRSFSIRQNEIRNEGDEMVIVPYDEIPTNERQGQTMSHDSKRKSSKSWRESSLRRKSIARPPNAPQVHSPQVLTSPCEEAGEVNYATESEEAGKPEDVQNLYRVLMLGGPGVGKTALTQQFLTSEFMAAQNTSFDDCVQVTVPVLLDGDSIFVEFIDLPYSGDTYQWREFAEVDGYVVVYSIIDRRSFNKAIEILDQIKCHVSSSKRPVILVANKNDLERSRLIGKQEGRNAAESRDCKYIDVSAILNHKVDDLLVGVLKQMRDSRRNRSSRIESADGDAVEGFFGRSSGDVLAGKMAGCFASSKSATAPRSENLWTRLIRKKSWKRILSRSCENLL